MFKGVAVNNNDYVEGFERVFTPEASAFFDKHGYCVFSAPSSPPSSSLDATPTAADNTNTNGDGNAGFFPSSPFSDAQANGFQKAIKDAFHANKFFPNKVEFLLPQGPIQLVKPNVFEYDMHNKDSEKDVPLMHEFFAGGSNKKKGTKGIEAIAEFLKNASMKFNEKTEGKEDEKKEGSNVNTFDINTPCSSTTATLSTLKTNPTLDMTLKLQVNTGGCFPWHYDNPSPPNKRLLTLAVYLTDPYVEARDGGQIQLLPFLGKPITVAPKFNTVVLFRSDLMLHRVLPFTGRQQQQQSKGGANSSGSNGMSNKEHFRCCFTVWLDGTSTNMPDDVNLKAKHLTESFVPFMLTSPIQRSLSRAIYDDRYREALIDCFGGDEKSRECIISLRMHEAHVKQLTGNPALIKFIEMLKEKRQF